MTKERKELLSDEARDGRTSWGAPIDTVKGEYVYKGTGCMAAPIALVDGQYAEKRLAGGEPDERHSNPRETARLFCTAQRHPLTR